MSFNGGYNGNYNVFRHGGAQDGNYYHNPPVQHFESTRTGITRNTEVMPVFAPATESVVNAGSEAETLAKYSENPEILRQSALGVGFPRTPEEMEIANARAVQEPKHTGQLSQKQKIAAWTVLGLVVMVVTLTIVLPGKSGSLVGGGNGAANGSGGGGGNDDDDDDTDDSDDDDDRLRALLEVEEALDVMQLEAACDSHREYHGGNIPEASSWFACLDSRSFLVCSNVNHVVGSCETTNMVCAGSRGSVVKGTDTCNHISSFKV